MDLLDFVTLDFEFGLHMPDRISIVEVGVQKFEHGKFGATFQTLINPESALDTYASDNIHHIYESDVLFAPTFADVWPQLTSFVGDLPVVVHGIKNEQRALITNCEFYQLPKVQFKFIDTLMLAQHLMPDLTKYNVHYLANYFDLAMSTDHMALDDATVTGQILLAMRQRFGVKKIVSLLN